MSLIRSRWVISTLLGFCLYAAEGAAQTGAADFTRILGSEDAEVSVPKTSLPLGQKDAAALQAIIDFLKATNGVAWTGMQASGTLDSGENEEPSAATLTVRNGDAFRLDVSDPRGKRSIRVQGNMGQIVESDGVQHRMPFATAALGLLAFPKLMASGFPSSQTSILDQHNSYVDGKTLHRVTVSEALFAGRVPTALDQVSTVDLYFDPTTHLLMKSVAAVQLDSRDLQRYIQAMTYGDYRQVNGVLLPFSYTQTLNGQRQWSLQLTTVQLGSSGDSSYFTF